MFKFGSFTTEMFHLRNKDKDNSQNSSPGSLLPFLSQVNLTCKNPYLQVFVLETD